MLLEGNTKYADARFKNMALNQHERIEFKKAIRRSQSALSLS